jgi:lipoate-protein ligase A
LSDRADREGASWRLLVHGQAGGRWNMAVDEALLDSYASATAPLPPTLRLYGWDPPALSLGKGQDSSTSHDPDFLRRAGIELVRRPTGGLAVLHEHERTYAVIAAMDGEPFTDAVLENYNRVAAALEAAMRRLGAAAGAVSRPAERPEEGAVAGPSCFDIISAHEIAVAGAKLIGSAQLRRRRAFLQHGSILIDSDPERLARALGAETRPSRFTDLRSVLGRSPGVEEIDRSLIAAFEESFSAELQAGDLSADELLRASDLMRVKYGSNRWTLTR